MHRRFHKFARILIQWMSNFYYVIWHKTRQELTSPVASTERKPITCRLQAWYGCNLHTLVNLYCAVCVPMLCTASSQMYSKNNKLFLKKFEAWQWMCCYVFLFCFLFLYDCISKCNQNSFLNLFIYIKEAYQSFVFVDSFSIFIDILIS